MKAVVLTLALLFLTGSQAQHETQQEEPLSQWEQVKALAQVYLNSAKVRGRAYIVKLEETDLAKNLNLTTVLEKLYTLNNKVTDLLPTPNWEKLKEEVGTVTGELNKDLTEVMKPYLEGIQKKWQERVEPLGQDLSVSVQSHLLVLQEKLRQLGEKVRKGAHEHMEQALEHVPSLPVILQPFGEELRECLEPGTGKLRECLEPYGEHLRQRLQALREGGVGLAKLREQVGEQLLALHKQAEPTLGEMHSDLQPLWESLQVAFLYGIGDISQRLTGQ
ncbi:apolipoprotein A-I [Myotis daubentonii]|uniref:apolipoprotein A-I n=1 Tax=Myotis daubentonii TaxID=98922 RepID=UPI0028731B0D|nr:apolipoprotein A-I [Myotis daubentonii]